MERRGLPPEPARGIAPPEAAGGLARPVRIEPSEATVGIERPADLPRPEEAGIPADDEPTREKRGGKKIKLLVFTGLVLIVVVGLGIAASMPAVANRFGLPWAQNAPKGDMPEPAAVTRVLQGPAGNGPAASAQGIAGALSGPVGNSALATLTGVVVDPSDGSVLWDHGSSTPATPASTTKLLTSAAALLSLDHDQRFSTKIVQGADPGTVVLVGGGDVTLTSLPIGTDSPLYPGAAHVDDLVAQVKRAAGDSVKKVQLDLSLFKGAVTAPGWDPSDAPSTFATQVAPVLADAGRKDPRNNDSARDGNAATLLSQRIASKLGATAGGLTTAPSGAKVLGEVSSAPLTEQISDLLQLSDDVLAEAVARQVAIANGEEASFAGGARATLKVLAAHGFDMTGVQLSDGSGISKLNKIPARLLSQILARAAAPDGSNPDTAKLRPLLAGLPVAGGSGTLADRFTGGAASGRGWVRAKTGSLTAVNTLAGLVLDADGRVLVFALMSEGSDTAPGREALDAVAAALRGCGCH